MSDYHCGFSFGDLVGNGCLSIIGYGDVLLGHEDRISNEDEFSLVPGNDAFSCKIIGRETSGWIGS